MCAGAVGYLPDPLVDPDMDGVARLPADRLSQRRLDREPMRARHTRPQGPLSAVPLNGDPSTLDRAPRQCALGHRARSPRRRFVRGGVGRLAGRTYLLAVAPHVRRQRIARGLVDESHEHLRRLGAQRITALVAHEEEEATGLWRSVGYENDDVISRFVRNL